MFNIGGGEFIVIAVLALIVLGPQRLPDVARQIGKTMGDLRRVSAGFQQEFQSAIDDVDPAAKNVVKQAMIRKVPGAMSPMGKGLSTAVAAVSAQGKAKAAADAMEGGEAAGVADDATAASGTLDPGVQPGAESGNAAPVPAQKAPAKRAPAKKAPAKKAPAKKAPAKKAGAKKAPAKKAPAKKAPAKKAPAKKAPAKKTTAKPKRAGR